MSAIRQLCVTVSLHTRQREGSIRFDVDLSPMASSGFERGRPGEDAVELARIVERGIRQSGAIDVEALCVLPGRKVGRGLQHLEQS